MGYRLPKIEGLNEIVRKLEISQPDFYKAQNFLKSEVLRFSDDYVPMDSGILKNTAFYTTYGDVIVYPAPYAQYHWHGKLMVDPITGKGAFHDPVSGRYWSRPGVQKVLTDRKMNYSGAPKRGDHWVDRMMQEEGDTII